MRLIGADASIYMKHLRKKNYLEGQVQKEYDTFLDRYMVERYNSFQGVDSGYKRFFGSPGQKRPSFNPGNFITGKELDFGTHGH